MHKSCQRNIMKLLFILIYHKNTQKTRKIFSVILFRHTMIPPLSAILIQFQMNMKTQNRIVYASISLALSRNDSTRSQQRENFKR